jgi:Divergent InlB B-repeat domain
VLLLRTLRRTTAAVALLAVPAASAGLANDDRPSRAVLKVRSGPGGLVRAGDGRLRCPGRCTGRYRRGSFVALSARPARHFTFDSWRGACIGTAPRCVVALDRRTSVRARFVRLQHAISATVGGQGVIVSRPAGLVCGATADRCFGEFGEGTTVKLVATARSGRRLRAWGGECRAGAAQPCRVTVARDVDVSAAFASATRARGRSPLTVTARGLRSSPAGIACPPDCRATYRSGQLVTLSSYASATVWSGRCAGRGLRCTVVVDRPIRVEASVPQLATDPVFGLNVSVSGPGSVASDPAPFTSAEQRIRCGGLTGSLRECEALFSPGTSVVLHAVVTRSGRFARWSSFCAGRRPVCVVRVTAPKTVVAVFRR